MNKKTTFWIMWVGIIFLSTILITQVAHIMDWWPKYKFGDQAITPKEDEALKGLKISEYVGQALYFFYFTIQSDLIAAGILISLYFIKTEQRRIMVFTIGASYMLILFVAYWLMLAPVQIWDELYGIIENIILHGILPIAFLIIWWKACPRIQRDKGEVISFSIVYPALYYVFAWSFYLAIDGKAAIYPFLAFYNPFFLDLTQTYQVVLLDIGIFVILFSFCLASPFLLMKLKNSLGKRGIKRALRV